MIKLLSNAFVLATLVIVHAANAADIRELEKNPIYFDGHWRNVSNIHGGTTNSGGSNHSGMFYPEKLQSLRNPHNAKQEVLEDIAWTFEDGLSLDGAMSYDGSHSRAVLTSAPLSRVIEISGPIAAGDAARLKQLIDETEFMECLEPGYCPFNNVISLNSPGGSLTEALEIAEFVYENNLITYIGENAECASACSMIFLSGATNFEGFFFPRRLAHETARLGLHQPYLRLPERDYSAEEVEKVVGIINTSLNRVVELFAKVRIDLAILQEMYATGPDGMYYLTVPELEQIGMVYRSTKIAKLQMTRGSALALCAEDFKSRYGRYDPALLTQMASDDGVFVTYVPRSNYACYGARRNGVWSYDVCLNEGGNLIDGFGCALYECAAMYTSDRCGERYPQDIVDVYNQDIGDALENMRNSKLLALTRDAIRTAPATQAAPSVTQVSRGSAAVPGWLASAQVPKEYCGKVDMRAIPNLVRIQTALNANGIDVGTPDGSIGPRTLGAIRQANKQFLGRDSQWTDPDLLIALGIPASEIPSFMHCQ